MSSLLDNHLDISVLVEMGFSKERVEQALAATNHQGIPPAIDWLFSHPVAEADSGQKLGGATNASIESGSEKASISMESGCSKPNVDDDNDKGGIALSLVCEDCGKQLRSEMEAQAHATRTGHQNFAESSEAPKPLTAEEKEEQRKKVLQILEERRLQRLEDEKKQEREREKARRKTGKEISQVKEDHARQEMKRIAEERRQEKLEEKRLRQKLKEQIAKDRADFKAKQEVAKITSAHNVSSTTTTNTPSTKKEYDSCRLQFRLADGSTINAVFKATDTLEVVHAYITENKKSTLPYTLSTSFPRMILQDSDKSKTLKELGLAPSAVLVIGK